MGCWHGYLSGARCRLAYGQADVLLIVSCFSKIQIGFTFLVPADPGSPGQRAVKRVSVLLSVDGLGPCAVQRSWSGLGRVRPLVASERTASRPAARHVGERRAVPTAAVPRRLPARHTAAHTHRQHSGTCPLHCRPPCMVY